MTKKLYIGNISYNASEEELKSLFEQAGEIESVKIIKDKYSGRSRGFGFVEMIQQESAEKAKEMFNGYSLKERKLIVNDARPQRERNDRSGFRRPKSRFDTF
jgi:RNA recognition motif-containing protein